MVKKFLIALILLAVLAALTAGAGWMKAWLMPMEPSFSAAKVTPGEKAAPGEEIRYAVTVTLPLTMKIAGAELEGPDVAATEAEYRVEKWKFDRRVWQVSGTFRTLKTGKIPEALLQVTAAGIAGEKTRHLHIPVPVPESEIPAGVSAGDELFLAPPAEIAGGDGRTPWYRNWKFWTAAGIILAVAAAAGTMFLRIRRKNAAELPLDQRTIRSIRRVCNEAKRREIGVETGFARLCDIVRDYLEARFGIPATRRTTVEFIRELASAASPLPEGERIFLTEFLNTADLIKFAGAETDGAALDQTGARAEELVRATTEKEEEK